MYKLIFFLIFLSSLFAKEIHPTYSFKSLGFINCFVVNEDKLYLGNDMGIVDVFNIKTKKILNQIILPPLTTAMNKLISQNIISIDYLNEKILIVSIGKKSFRNVWIYKNNELKQIIDESKKLTIKKAMFVNDEKILFGTFGSDIILHDLSESYNLYTSHVTQSTMGGLVLSSDKTKMIMSYESGEVKLIDVKSSKVQKIYNSQNVDFVHDVAYSNGVIITAGQDRRVAIYIDDKKDSYIKSHFMVYSVGLSPSGEIGAYSSGDEQNIQLFNPKTKVLQDILVGHTTKINQIYFKNEKEIFSVGSKKNVFYWKLN